MMEEADDGLVFAARCGAGASPPHPHAHQRQPSHGLSIGKDDEMVPVDEFVEKPVDPALLVAKVDSLLAGKGA